MDREFHSIYSINKRWTEKMFWKDVTASQLFSSAMFPIVLFLLAWFLQAKGIKLICILGGLGLILWALIHIKKNVKLNFDSFSKSFGSFSGYQIETAIEKEEVKYTLKHDGQCLRTASVPLSRFPQFTRHQEFVAIKEDHTNNALYFYGTSSELQKLATFLEQYGLKNVSVKIDPFGKLASIGLIVLSFVLAVCSFFPSQTNVVPLLEAWEKKGGYTAQVDWTKNSLSEFDCQVSSVWIEKDKLYRIERSEEKGETQQVILSSFDNGKAKCIRLDAKGYVKLIEEKEITRTDFFLDPIIDPCEDAFLFDSSNKIQPSPYFSWKKEGNQIIAALEDTNGFAQYRVGKEEDSYTEEQLNSMDTMERMNLHYSGRIKPDHADFTFTVQDKRIIKVSFDELVRISESEEEREGTISVQDLSIQPSAKEQVENLFERSVRHGSTIDLNLILQ